MTPAYRPPQADLGESGEKFSVWWFGATVVMGIAVSIVLDLLFLAGIDSVDSQIRSAGSDGLLFSDFVALNCVGLAGASAVGAYLAVTFQTGQWAARSLCVALIPEIPALIVVVTRPWQLSSWAVVTIPFGVFGALAGGYLAHSHTRSRVTL